MDRPDRKSFLSTAGFIEGGLVLLAFAIGVLIDLDPLLWFRWTGSGFVRGVLATVPLMIVFGVVSKIDYAGFRDVETYLVRKIGPILDGCHWWDLLYLSALAGFCEEILFRGLVQPALMQVGGMTFALIATSVLFGLCHAVTRMYAVLAGVMSLYLGWILYGLGEQNLLIPITAHMLYDLFAFFAIRAQYRDSQKDATT